MKYVNLIYLLQYFNIILTKCVIDLMQFNDVNLIQSTRKVKLQIIINTSGDTCGIYICSFDIKVIDSLH